jgi:CRISPR/Cas system CMR subunit Cmr4 (Cas7 group RAMP superfamily)
MMSTQAEEEEAETEEAGEGEGSEPPAAGDEAAPPKPMDKETVAAELRRLATGKRDGGQTHLQIGGDESVGLGITRLVWGRP